MKRKCKTIRGVSSKKKIIGVGPAKDGWSDLIARMDRAEGRMKEFGSKLDELDWLLVWHKIQERFDDVYLRLADFNVFVKAYEDKANGFQRKVKEEGLLIHGRITAVTKELNLAKSELHLVSVAANRFSGGACWNLWLWNRWFGIRPAA